MIGLRESNIGFPDCAKWCRIVDEFGVCECESVCPHKFPAERFIDKVMILGYLEKKMKEQFDSIGGQDGSRTS